MHLVVTGAFGTIGTAVLAEARARGHRATAFELPTPRNGRFAHRLARRGSPTVWGDVRDVAALRAAVAGCDGVFHAAALLPPVTETAPDLAEAVNVGGTRNVIAAMREVAPGAALVFPSSISVYGPTAHLDPPRRADDPVNPTDRYTHHKVACEEIVRSSGLERWLILRVGVVAEIGLGTKSNAGMLRSLFEIPLDTRMDYLDPRDAATAIVNAFESDDVWGRVLPIGGGARSQVRHRDLVDASMGALGIDLPDAAFGDAPYYTDWLDSDETERLLHYQHHGFPEFRDATARRLRPYRVLLTPLRPLVRRVLLRYSRPWQEATRTR